MNRQRKSSSRQSRESDGIERARSLNRKDKDPMGNSQFSAPTTVVFPDKIIGFPDRLVTTLRYSESYSFGGSGSPGVQQWNVNSAFDPNQTGSGHQPSFYDTFSAIYGRYYVEAFKLDCFVVNQLNIGCYGALGYADQSIGSDTVEQIIEAKYSKPFFLAPSGSGDASKKISLPWMSTAQLMGQPYTEADDNMYAAVGSNPGDIAWGHFKLQAVDGTTTVSVYMRVIIHMRIRFKDLLPQVSS